MIDVVASIKKQMKAQVKNIRDMGICITTHEPLDKGKFLTLEISHQGMDKLKIKGKVMWSLQIGSHFFENGIDFSVLNTCQQESYIQFQN